MIRGVDDPIVAAKIARSNARYDAIIAATQAIADRAYRLAGVESQREAIVSGLLDAYSDEALRIRAPWLTDEQRARIVAELALPEGRE